MKLEELKVIRRFLKREMKWQEQLFQANLSQLEERFYQEFCDTDWENNIKGIRDCRKRWHFLAGLLDYIDEEIEKKEKRLKKK